MFKEIKITRKVILKLFLFLLIAVFSAVYIRYTWIKTDHEQSDNILQIGKSIEASLPKENLKILDVRPSDIDKPEYQLIKKTLQAIILANPKAKFAYIYIPNRTAKYILLQIPNLCIQKIIRPPDRNIQKRKLKTSSHSGMGKH